MSCGKSYSVSSTNPPRTTNQTANNGIVQAENALNRAREHTSQGQTMLEAMRVMLMAEMDAEKKLAHLRTLLDIAIQEVGESCEDERNAAMWIETAANSLAAQSNRYGYSVGICSAGESIGISEGVSIG